MSCHFHICVSLLERWGLLFPGGRLEVTTMGRIGIMKKIFKRVGLAFIAFWLLGVVYRLFFEKTPIGIHQEMYTALDAVIDGSLIIGIILLIVSVFFKKPKMLDGEEEKGERS